MRFSQGRKMTDSLRRLILSGAGERRLRSVIILHVLNQTKTTKSLLKN